jgi:Type IV secretion-system coupling protein DNA-binding domain
MYCTSCGHEWPERARFCVACGQRVPHEEQANQAPTILGLEMESHTEVCVSQTERQAGLYVIGKPGMGKTTFLVNLALQDIHQGNGVCIIDPHGDAIKEIVARLPEERVDEVILLDPLDTAYPFALNLLTCPDPNDGKAAAETETQVVHIFKKLYGPTSETPSWGPRLESLLRYSVLTLIENPGHTILEIPLLLTNEGYRDHLLKKVRNPAVHDFWYSRFAKWKSNEQAAHIESTLNKIDPFQNNEMTRNIIGQPRSLEFRSLMEAGKIVLVELPARLGDISKLLGAALISQLLHAAHTRTDIEPSQRREFYLFADEYQRFATEDFATLLDEARKFAVGTTIAHQGRSQLDETNRGASMRASTLVIFGVSGEDAKELAGELEAKPQPGEARLERVVYPIGIFGLLGPPKDELGRPISLYEEKPGALRESRVIEDAKAETLRTMPKWEAFVKITRPERTAEHQIYTSPMSEPTGDLHARLARIQDRTRSGLCRPRAQVEEEIRQRRDLGGGLRSRPRATPSLRSAGPSIGGEVEDD